MTKEDIDRAVADAFAVAVARWDRAKTQEGGE